MDGAQVAEEAQERTSAEFAESVEFFRLPGCSLILQSGLDDNALAIYQIGITTNQG
jgi:hypothetical protein